MRAQHFSKFNSLFLKVMKWNYVRVCVLIWISYHLAAASGKILMQLVWGDSCAPGSSGGRRTQRSQTFPSFPCVGQSITVSSLTLLCSGSIIELEEDLLSIHCCKLIITTCLHRPVSLTQFELEHMYFDLLCLVIQ